MWTGIDPQRAIQMVQRSPVIAFDTETTGLEQKDKPVGYVITDTEASIYIPTKHVGGGNILYPDEFLRVLNLSFKDRARRNYRTVGHNVGFDLRMCNKDGVFPEYPLEDSMLNEGLLDDTTRGYGLDDCTKRHGVTQKLGDELYRDIASKYGGLPDRKSMANFHRMAGDHASVVDYACGDGISTLELWQKQQPMLDAQELRRVHDLECRLIHRVARIYRRGLRVDEKYGNELTGSQGIIARKLAEAQSGILAGVNVQSPIEVERLYRANGFRNEQFSRTATGAISFAEEWLKTNEIGERILAVRHLRKALSSFITPLMEKRDVKGYIHPTLNQSKSDEFGAIGARFSCSDPNLQAFPKRNKSIGQIVRRLVIADDGFELQEGDAKQQEPRLFAYFSEDERLLQGYRSGTMDIHGICSNDFGLPRDTAKRLAMGILTGLSAKGLAGHMGWDYNTASDYHHAFLNFKFPKIKEFQKAAKDIFRTTGYVKSISGRKARLEDPKFAYRGVSRIIQNSGGDLMKMTLLRACEYEEAHPQVQILMTIHDSLMWQREQGFDTSELIKICEAVPMEFNVDVPIPYELGTGTNWAEASYGK